LDEWFVIVKPFCLEITHNGKKVRNQLELMCFQESAKAADDIEAMVFGEVSAKAFINQDACVGVRKSRGDGVTFSSVEHVEPWIRLHWSRYNGDPAEIVKVRDCDRTTSFAFVDNALDNVKMAMDRLKEIESLYRGEGKQRCCV